MNRLYLIALRLLAVPFFTVAFLVWIGREGPDFSFGGFGSGGILDVGLIGMLLNTIGWLAICIIALPGVLLWSFAGRFSENKDEE